MWLCIRLNNGGKYGDTTLKIMVMLQKVWERQSQAHLAKLKRIGWSIGFNSWPIWTLYSVIPRSLCKIRFNGVSEMFSCWGRRWIDVDGDSRTVFGFSRFGLSMMMPVSFFSTELTMLLFFQNPYEIFAHIYNITIIKLIICQTRHKLSATIHEISTSWK